MQEISARCLRAARRQSKQLAISFCHVVSSQGIISPVLPVCVFEGQANRVGCCWLLIDKTVMHAFLYLRTACVSLNILQAFAEALV